MSSSDGSEQKKDLVTDKADSAAPAAATTAEAAPAAAAPAAAAAAGSASQLTAASPDAAAAALAEKLAKLNTGGRPISKEEMQRDMLGMINRARKAGKSMEDHAFWKTQPVQPHGEKASEHAPIENKQLEEVQKNPYPLPKGYEWVSMDVTNKAELKEIHDLLLNNYVEDDDAMFRFAYSHEFLTWALCPPHFVKDWHVGVRASTSTGARPLVALITAVPADIAVHSRSVKAVEINFLCVHKQLRSKRLAPVLIKEVTRRVNLRDVWQAVYTAGVVIPKPVAVTRYYHRSLNPRKLIEIGFSRMPQLMTMARMELLYKLPQAPVLPGVRPLEKKDVAEACKLVNERQTKFKLTQVFSEDEFSHIFLPRDDVVYSYVFEDPASKKLLAFGSFYSLPSTIINNPKHNLLRAAYCYYTVPGPFGLDKVTNDLLILAKQSKFDVFNMLDLMDNESLIKDLKFGRGDGTLQYYLYNWRCPDMKAGDVGLVLL